MKHIIITTAGVVGGFISSLFGGWSAAMTTLLIFMAIDYFSGLLVAGLFHTSKKTVSGRLSSHACFKGLVKKCMILLFVLIGARIDLILGSSLFKDAICIAFIVNELISVVENAGLMGVPVPGVVTKAIDMLMQGGDRGDGTASDSM